MKTLTLRLARGAALLAAVATVSACGLPRSGPNKQEIFSGSVLREGDAFVLAVDDRVNRIAGVTPALGFSAEFLNSSIMGSDTIRAGDVLGITVWENVDDGLLSVSGAPSTRLEEVQVDGEGYIFVPYAGRIKAAGSSPEAIRQIITEKLALQTPEPQVEVRRVAGDGSTVTILGSSGGQGVFPIERPTRTLASMLASAGGITGTPEITRITVIRGSKTGSIWFSELQDHPEFDIALRNGDRINVEDDGRSFTALGATGSQRRVPFFSQTISVIDAIAQVGGLSSVTADPTGIFVFRNEPEAIAQQLMGDPQLIGTQRVIYVLDLTQPNGMFMARDFAIRDGDTVYVTEAPFVQFNKAISAATGTLFQVNGLGSLASGG